MNMIFTILLLSLLYIFLVIFGSKLSKDFSIFLDEKENEEAKSFFLKFKKEKKNKIKEEIFYNSYFKQLIIKEKKKCLWWTPFWVGVFEYVSFSLIMIFVFDLSFILKCFAGWMAIKCIGGYASWSDIIFGRANFYTFLLRSIFNIFLALLSGFIIKGLWFYIL